MTTTDKFQILPTFYSSLEECKQRKPVQTNPRYREFTQTHFTAGDEEQFHEFRDFSNSKNCNQSINLENNKFVNSNFSDIIKWEKYKGISAISVNNTFNYLFHKFKKGIFVKIQDNKLKVFLPFSKKNFINEWSNKIAVDPKFKDMHGFSEYINKLSGVKHKTSVNGYTDAWYANNCLIRYEYPINEGDSNVSNVKDMLETLCSERKVPDLEFFLNRRDFPQIMKNGTEAYDHIFGDNQPLLSHNYETYAPVLSMATTENNADIPIPTGDDWGRISAEESKFFAGCKTNQSHTEFSVKWKTRKPTAIFRGTSTGCGVTIDTNMRLKAAYISSVTPVTDEGLLLDAGITKWQLRPRKLKGEKYLQTIDVPFVNKNGINLVPFMSLAEQATYKYLIHLDGHVSAFRLSLELSMGCCILIADSKYRLWFRNMLKPMVHYIPIKSDLSDLVDKIKWCRNNDKKCKEISKNAKEFYLKYLQKDGILDYLQKIFVDLKKHTGEYFYNCKTPLEIQLKFEKKYIRKSSYPSTLKDIKDLNEIPKQGRSFGVLKGLEWIVNMINEKSSFTKVAKKSKNIFSNNAETVSIDKYKLSGYVFAVKSSSDIPKINQNIHEAFIGCNAINELVKYIPNFVYIFGADTQSTSVIVEYIEGDTFFEWIKSDSFNDRDFIFILLQIAFALEVAQNKCGFVHYDLTPWNIMIQTLDKETFFDYVIDDGSVYRITTKYIPVIIDYGKSHVICDKIHYGYVNMFKMSTIQDIISIILTSLNEVIKHRLDKINVDDILKVANFLSNTKYRKEKFKSSGSKGVTDIKNFIEKAKKYSEMINSDKGELEEKTPLDFINHIQNVFSISFPIKRVNTAEFRLNKGNPKQVFDYILSSSIKEQIKSFTDVFDKVSECEVYKTNDAVLLYYSLQTLEANITSIYNFFKRFLTDLKIDISTHEKSYKKAMKKIKSRADTLEKSNVKKLVFDSSPNIIEKIHYTQDTFLLPDRILDMTRKYKKVRYVDLSEYKNTCNNIVLDTGAFQVPEKLKNDIKNMYSKLMMNKSVKMMSDSADKESILYYAEKVYAQDKKMLSELVSGSDCGDSVEKHISDIDKILDELVNEVENELSDTESKKSIEGESSEDESNSDLSSEKESETRKQERKEIHKTDAITITFGDQAENHAGMQKIGKAQDTGFSVEELKDIKKFMEKKGLKCELVNLNKALPEEFRENSDSAAVLVIKGMLNSFGMCADELFHELKTVKWDTFLVSTRTTEIQIKHARANICISNAEDIPMYTKEDKNAHKNSDYWQDENLSALYKKQQDQRKAAGERVKLSKQEVQSGKGTVVKWETLSVLKKFKKYIEENFGPHANNLVAEGNSYTDLKKCYIGPHGDTERNIVIAIRLGKPFPMYFHWYHKSKPIGELITLPVLNHGDAYIMSQKAVGQDWKSSSKITLRHSAGCIASKTEFKK